jgi:hypothetical protein
VEGKSFYPKPEPVRVRSIKLILYIFPQIFISPELTKMKRGLQREHWPITLLANVLFKAPFSLPKIFPIPPKILFHQKYYSIKNIIPSKILFHQKYYSSFIFFKMFL